MERIERIEARKWRSDAEAHLYPWLQEERQRRQAEQAVAEAQEVFDTAQAAYDAEVTKRDECRAEKEKAIEAEQEIRRNPQSTPQERQQAQQAIRHWEREEKSAEQRVRSKGEQLSRPRQQLRDAQKKLEAKENSTIGGGLKSLALSSTAFVKHLVGASGVLATLCAGTLALAATTRNGTGLTPSLTWAMFLALGGIVLGLVFHGIPFFSHMGDWFHHRFQEVGHQSVSRAFQRESRVQAVQAVLVFLQLGLWGVAVGLLMGNLISGDPPNLEVRVPGGTP